MLHVHFVINWVKQNIKINFFSFFNVATRKCRPYSGARIIVLWDSAALRRRHHPQKL